MTELFSELSHADIYLKQISRALFEHWEYRLVTCIRGVLIAAIYDKMLRLKVDDLENSAAVTLMSTDVDGIEQLISMAYESWTCVIQLALGIWLLYRFVGPACFLIFIPTLCMSNTVADSSTMSADFVY